MSERDPTRMTSPTGEAIVVKNPANAGTPDALLAVGGLIDLNGLGPGLGGGRVIRRVQQGTTTQLDS